MLRILGGFTDFLTRPRPEGLDLDQPDPYPLIFQQPNRLSSLRDSGARCHDEDLSIRVFGLDQSTDHGNGVFAGSFTGPSGFLLPGRVGHITDVVGLHDKRISHHPDRRRLHVHAGNRRAVGVIRRQTHLRRREQHRVLCVCDKETVTADGDGQVHVRLLRDDIPFEDPVKKVLRGLGMPHQHPRPQQEVHLQGIGLNAQG